VSPCRSKPILIVCDKEMVLESVEHVPVVAKEKEVVPFDDWGGSGGEFNGGVVDVCSRGKEEALFQCRLEGGFEREQHEGF